MSFRIKRKIARRNNDNFYMQELLDAIDYAHKKGKSFISFKYNNEGYGVKISL